VRRQPPPAHNVFLAFNRRFDPSAMQRSSGRSRRVKSATLEQLTITSRDPAPPPLDYLPKSGGLFRDMMIHDFDMARWLLGKEPVSICSRSSCLVDPQIGKLGDIDTACVALATASERPAFLERATRSHH
jgi:myo-inositol 2-dehydrogenase/D-chiro-inositol 1-dehydrogenase